MTQASTTPASTKPAKPKYTGFMGGYLVVFGIYQVFLAAQHGGLDFGKGNLFYQDLSTAFLSFFYLVMGILLVIIGYGIYTLKWWAIPVGLVVQGMIIAVALAGIIRWLELGQQAPIIFDAVDLLFAAMNLSWAFSRDVRTAFQTQPSGAAQPSSAK